MTSTNITFVNKISQNINIFWVNGAEEVKYYTLVPGQEYNQQTYEGVQWSIRTDSGELLQQTVGQVEPIEVIITEANPSQPSPTPTDNTETIWDHGTLFIRGIKFIPEGMESSYTGL